MITKNYSYTYPSIKCLKTKMSDNVKKHVDFKEGYFYPFTCLSYDINEEIESHRAVQIISESGYKLTFKDDRLIEYFDIENIVVQQYLPSKEFL
ncbi:MAG: hypothetical protein ATN34_04670 [Epulopiscium sp. Nele67-Bin002]|nr:MAG: hypothetical protein BEN18_03305 [Epulopiscium sp. Nuni2H_MBin001]OON90583.1 MAG: hypothetical protein ATN34_04670 [Epulopiscium sp. Nele67-Bin002]OON91972.1 MAG: hypothetical protein ATN33_08275 [Epulopiscium sp. Nele67-Bin001]